MSDIKSQNVRVIVQLHASAALVQNNNPHDELGEHSDTSISEQNVANKSSGEVKIMDEKSFRLILSETTTSPHIQIAHNMRFDGVRLVSDDALPLEVCDMLKEMFLKQQNFCLIRFAAMRKPRLHFLHHLLVSEVHRNLLQLKLAIESISIKFVDLNELSAVACATSMQDVLNRFGSVSSMRQRCLLQQEWRRQSLDGAHDHNKANAKQHFSSTVELLRWLLHDYRMRSTELVHTEHEALEISFNYKDAFDLKRDSQSAVRNVKLVLMFVAYHEMSMESRHNFHSFLKGCRHSVNQQSSYYPRLQEYVQIGNVNQHLLLLYDVPLKCDKLTDCAIEMLQSAHSIVKYRNENKCELSEQHEYLKDMKLNEHELNSLSLWYKKIDQKYVAARSAMERHYNYCYGLRMKQMCANVKYLPQHIDYVDQTLTDVEIQLLKWHYEQYQTALAAFLQLRCEINAPQYVDILGAYFKAKDYELSQLSLQTRLEHLKLWQISFENAFNEESVALKAKLFNGTQ